MTEISCETGAQQVKRHEFQWLRRLGNTAETHSTLSETGCGAGENQVSHACGISLKPGKVLGQHSTPWETTKLNPTPRLSWKVPTPTRRTPTARGSELSLRAPKGPRGGLLGDRWHSGVTPLHLAGWKGHSELVRVLLTAGPGPPDLVHTAFCLPHSRRTFVEGCSHLFHFFLRFLPFTLSSDCMFVWTRLYSVSVSPNLFLPV